MQPELRMSKTYWKRQNPVQNKSDVQNLENLLWIPFGYLGDFYWDFFALGDFFLQFFDYTKGSSFNFFLKFCNRMDVKKSQMVPNFTFFRHYETSKFSFLSDIRFSQKTSFDKFSIRSEFRRWWFENIALSPNFWRNIRTILRFTKEEAQIRRQAILFVPARYIRIFDVISEIICVLLRRNNRIEKSARIGLSTLLLNFWSVFRLFSVTSPPPPPPPKFLKTFLTTSLTFIKNFRLA